VTRDPRVLVRQPHLWITAAALVGLMVVQVLLIEDRVGFSARVVFTILPIGLLALTFSACILRGRWLAIGALALAINPTILAAVAASESQGAFAMILACVAVGAGWLPVRASRLTIIVAVPVIFAGIVLWVVGTESRVEGPAPSFNTVVGDTGQVLKGAFGQVGAETSSLPMTAQLLWWGSVGLLVGASIGARRLVASLAAPLAVVLLVIVAWGTVRWRGPVSGEGGLWIVAAAISFTGASVRLDRIPERRIGRILLVVACWMWFVGVAQQVRSVVVDPVPPNGDWAFWSGWQLTTTTADPVALLGVALGLCGLTAIVLWASLGRERLPRGVNVIGYLDATSGLGNRARELIATLEKAQVLVSRWPVDSAQSPRHDDSNSSEYFETEIVYDTTIAVVTAQTLPSLLETHARQLTGVRRVIGYWFWELEDVPPETLQAIEIVDEIWAPTVFVRDAYSRAATKPVRLVPLPIARPAFSSVSPGDLGMRHGRFVFFVSFDHLSVMERKNPLGAIDAFQRAFTVEEQGVELLIKTINREHKPDAAARLDEAAANDDRIRIWDEHLMPDHHCALIERSDVFVSLHRSEGLGLQLADAMWLGTPVLATRYSGNLDLMTDVDAALVDAALTPVRNADGAYAEGSLWADPDLDHAAALMVRLFEDRSFGANLAASAADRMENQATQLETGSAIRRLLSELGLSDSDLVGSQGASGGPAGVTDPSRPVSVS
jgi:glycosyltransferase involved in cell wall biosynthesis